MGVKSREGPIRIVRNGYHFRENATDQFSEISHRIVVSKSGRIPGVLGKIGLVKNAGPLHNGHLDEPEWSQADHRDLLPAAIRAVG